MWCLDNLSRRLLIISYGGTALPDRRAERDELRDRLARKKEVEPILAEIQRLRKGLDLAPREWEDDEIFGATAVVDRTEERDQLREVKPICEEIHQLRSKLGMEPRDVSPFPPISRSNLCQNLNIFLSSKKLK